jgi:hypothetical protein
VTGQSTMTAESIGTFTLYEVADEGGADYFLTQNGTSTVTSTETSDSRNGAYTRSAEGVDTYQIVQTGTDRFSAAINLTLGGTETWDRTETGNSQNGDFSRTLTAEGSNGVSFTQTATGNFLNGNVDRSQTGDSRYDLLPEFHNPVGEDPEAPANKRLGNEDFSAEGAPFSFNGPPGSVTGGGALAAGAAAGAADMAFTPGSGQTGAASFVAAAGLGSALLYEYCFARGTPVLLSDGTSRPIEQIEPGTKVKAAFDHAPDGELVDAVVERRFDNAPAALLNVHTDLSAEPIRATHNHPWYVRGRGWVATRDLRPGDELRTAGGRTARVTELFDNGDIEPVYNLQVAGARTYFVRLPGSDDAVLVHNTSPDEAREYDDSDFRGTEIKKARTGRTVRYTGLNSDQTQLYREYAVYLSGLDRKIRELKQQEREYLKSWTHLLNCAANGSYNVNADPNVSAQIQKRHAVEQEFKNGLAFWNQQGFDKVEVSCDSYTGEGGPAKGTGWTTAASAEGLSNRKRGEVHSLGEATSPLDLVAVISSAVLKGGIKAGLRAAVEEVKENAIQTGVENVTEMQVPFVPSGGRGRGASDAVSPSPGGSGRAIDVKAPIATPGSPKTPSKTQVEVGDRVPAAASTGVGNSRPPEVRSQAASNGSGGGGNTGGDNPAPRGGSGEGEGGSSSGGVGETRALSQAQDGGGGKRGGTPETTTPAGDRPTTPDEVTVTGPADPAIETPQAKRFGVTIGVKKFKFFENTPQGIEGVFEYPNAPGVEVPFSLKRLHDVDKIGNLNKVIRRNSNQCLAAGQKDVVFYGEPIQFTADQIADFVKKGPISQAIIHDGAFKEILLRGNDGIVSITRNGVKAIR